ncbi:unnamed protein product [Protopolystoma xenopodis]|uniref:Uncharacterized protein n=1 Tax=Protopolystoma xenopodis TaxID=117903 RepID=A0A448WX02_9PLAT|nr:unnamed protein product [Protopolystoma xenopodis]
MRRYVFVTRRPDWLGRKPSRGDADPASENSPSFTHTHPQPFTPNESELNNLLNRPTALKDTFSARPYRQG